MSDSHWLRAVLVTFAAGFLACGADEMQDLRARAAFDLDCPAHKLRIRELGDGVEGVQGCGERGTYVQVCHGAGAFQTDCRWVRNGGRSSEHHEDE
jgi:hypothetical protein